MNKQIEVFNKKWDAFEKGETEERPVFYKDYKVKINSEDKKVILTMEEYDRDEEIVMVDGIRIRDAKQGIPMIDSHQMNGSVTINGLGAVRNLRKEIIDGKNALVGDPEFAPTPNGQIAEILYMGVNGGMPFMDNVSIGFAVYEYDRSAGKILDSELFELSLVTVGANYGARFTSKSISKEKMDETIAKDLARFKAINPVFKEFSKTFLSESFCKTIGYEKDGNMLLDINNIYDIILERFSQKTKQEAPESQEKVEAPQTETKTSEQEIRAETERTILEALDKAFERAVSKRT